ncbi:TPA: cyclic diguanylate phosphodiesterase, partial [Escherichia coli]|nr:cyclic diguanylate phosphodiesterase [Escherichia coli]
TEAALKPHLRTIIILKQGIVWCTSLPGNRVLLSRIPVFPDSNLLLAPAIDTVNRLPILLYQNQFADTRILVTISDQHIRGALNVPLKGVRYVLRVAD